MVAIQRSGRALWFEKRFVYECGGIEYRLASSNGQKRSHQAMELPINHFETAVDASCSIQNCLELSK
jgi:hypothetical protein